MRSVAVVLVLSVLTVGPAPTSRTDVGPGPGWTYRPPVDAPVLDPFRAPSTPYGPGNRGLEYGCAPGTPATAIGPGVVTFAGPVAGRGVVTVTHPDGLRSSLTGLAAIAVVTGRAVEGGTVLGTTGAALHLGVRRGGEYIDPATLFEDLRPRHARLVPVPHR